MTTRTHQRLQKLAAELKGRNAWPARSIGTAAMLKLRAAKANMELPPGDLEKHAMTYFGLSEKSFRYLFDEFQYPDGKVTPQQMAERIELFLAEHVHAC